MESKSGIIWVRVSTQMQTQGYSQDYQLRECEQIVKRDNLHIEKVFRVDETSTRWWKRKEFKEMSSFVKENDIEFLLIYTVDRLLRNIEDYIYHIKPLIVQNEVKLFCVQQNLVIRKNSKYYEWGELEKAIVDATQEGRKIGERTFKGMEEKARKGSYPAFAPLGYLNIADPNDPENDPKRKRRTIIIDSDRAPLIKKAFELYAGGRYSLSSLCNEMNQLGLKIKESRSKKRGLRPISKHGLQSVLRNIFYVWQFRWNQITWPGNHPAIIDRNLFDAVQAKLEENVSNPKGSTKKYFPFKFLLKCEHCFSSITAEEGWRDHIYYRCTKYRNHNCPGRDYRQEEIDQILAENL